MRQIASCVKQLISKGTSAEFISFAINYFADKKSGQLHYPGGIAYIIKDQEMREAWFSKSAKQMRKEIDEQKPVIEQIQNEIPVYTQTSRLNSFADILAR